MTNPERREKIRSIINRCTCYECEGFSDTELQARVDYAVKDLEALMPQVMSEEDIFHMLPKVWKVAGKSGHMPLIIAKETAKLIASKLIGRG